MENNKIPWTEEQLNAINAKGDVIVSASAGSGKTGVMVERVVRLIQSGAHLKNMLLCTFTTASADDMREKLHRRLYELSPNDPHIASVCDYLPQADICTLHSWCLSVNKAYFFACDIDPSASLLEEGEALLLKRQAVKKVLEKHFIDPAQGFSKLYDSLRIRGGNGLEELVLSVCDFAASLESPIEFLNTCENRLSKNDAIKIFEQGYKSKSDALAERYGELAAFAEQVQAKQFFKYIADLGGMLNGIETPLRLPKGAEESNPELTALCRGIKKDYSDLCESYDSFFAALDIEDDGTAAALAECARDTYALYQTLKSEQSYYDYEDMMHGALKVLNNPDCRQALTERYRYIFIDEYQDINPLQHAIISSFKNKSEIFLVGDIKQSIYGFRRCSPRYFEREFNSGAYTAINLNRNFRSSQPVIDFVNDVFCACMTAKNGGVNYADDARLLCSRTNIPGAAVSFETLKGESEPFKARGVYSVKEDVCGGEDEGNDAKTVNLIAYHILKLIESGAQKTDIAVLTRSRELHDYIVKTLKDLGVSATAVFKTRVTELSELKTLFAVLKLISNRNDDISLAMALKSMFCALDEKALYTVAKSAPVPFHKAARLFAQNGADVQIREKLCAFYAKLDEYRTLSHTLKADELLGVIISQNRYFEYLLSIDRQKAENLNAFLLQLAASPVNVSIFTLLRALEEGELYLKPQEPSDAVKVMTVHAAKGLEFPFVILAQTEKQFNTSDLKQRLIVSEEYGLCLKHFDSGTRKTSESYRYIIAKEQQRLKNYGEEMRLLYVALTRARDKLIVLARGEYGLNPRQAATAKCFAHFIASGRAVDCTRKIRDCILPKITKSAPLYIHSDPQVAKSIKERIEFKADFEHLPLKTVVTALSADGEDAQASYDYSDKSLPKEEAAQRGTAYHFIMEHIDFDCFENSYAALEKSYPDITALVDKNKIRAAADSMRELTAGNRFFREQSFVANCKRNELGIEGQGNILVQGVIDLLILNGDGAVIVDYKSAPKHKVNSPSYKKQLDIYAYSVEKILKLKVKKRLIYSFASDALVDLS